MRVLFVISGLGMGGAERQSVLLAREISRAGHAVRIYTLNHRDARAQELKNSGVEVLYDNKTRALDFGLLFRLRRDIRRWRPDVVHGFLYDGNIYSRFAALGTGVPVVASERSDRYRIAWHKRLLYRLTSRWCAALVANSHSGAAFAAPLHGVGREATYVVWNGIDLEEVDRRLAASACPSRQIWPEQGTRRVCMVGSIKPAKDYPLALRAMRCLADRSPSWRFICVGDLPSDGNSADKTAVGNELRRLELEAIVLFTGRREDALEIIASADVLLISSTNEGFPNVVLEAMACGTPVASTEYSDIRQLLPYEWQITRNREPQALADAVERCFVESRDVAIAQRKWVEANATSAASATKLLSIYGYLGICSETYSASVVQ